MFPERRADRLSLVVLAVVTAAGLALLPRLPEAVAVHFAGSGAPDNYVSRSVAVFSGPALVLATIIVIRAAAHLDPPTDERSVDTLVLGIAAMEGVVYLLVLGWNIGYAVPLSLVVVGSVLWTLALAGYVVLRETTA
jgi:uncharacterized membrane protein